MSGGLRVLMRAVAVAVPIGLGALAIGYSAELNQLPSGKDKTPAATPVRVMTLAPVQLKPRVVGHGTVVPVREWRAVARIDGEVVMTADQLAAGETVSAGTELLRLGDTDLKLALAQIDAQLASLVVKDQTLAASREIAQADLALSQAELKRQQDLAGRGVTTQASLDTSRRQELAARSKVVDVENQLALNGAERNVLEAQRATAARSLEFTSVVAPYDVRLTDVAAELGQVVSRGQVMITAEGTEAVEVAAQFPIGQVGPLVRMLPSGTVDDLKAKVRLPAADHTVSWDAKVVRAGEAIDARTQSTPLVVRVDNPLAQAQAGSRPPLRRNTFVEVVLSAPPRPGAGGAGGGGAERHGAGCDRRQHARAASGYRRLHGRRGRGGREGALRRRQAGGHRPGHRRARHGRQAGRGQGDGGAGRRGGKRRSRQARGRRREGGDRFGSGAKQPGQGGHRRQEGARRGDGKMIRLFAAHPTAANILMLAFIVLGLAAAPSLQRDTFPLVAPTDWSRCASPIRAPRRQRSRPASAARSRTRSARSTIWPSSPVWRATAWPSSPPRSSKGRT